MPHSREEFYNEAKSMLRSYGVSDPQVGEPGSIPVTPGSREIIDVTVTDATRPSTELLNQFPRHRSDRVLFRVLQENNSLACGLLKCPALNLLGIECSYEKVTWTDPRINGQVVPNAIPEATAYLNPFNARIEGSVNAEFSNSSEPGKKHTQTVYKCQENGPVRTNVIEESAVVDVEHNSRMYSVGSGELISEIVHELTDLSPDEAVVSGDYNFRKEGALNTIEAILDVWTTGSMRAKFEGTMTATYEWKGSSRTKEFDVQVEARIPVRNLNYAW